MTFSLFITIFVFVILFRYAPFYKREDLHPFTLPGAFILKFAVGILLIWIHEHVYRMDDFSHDGQRFLREGEYVYRVFSISVRDYIKLLTGVGESPELVAKYLHMTNYWSAGDLTLINDSKNVIRIHSLIHFFSGGNRLIHTAVFCFFSLIGLIFLHKAFARFVRLNNNAFFVLLLIVPSTLFWSSSMMKEPLMFLGIGLFSYGLLGETSALKRWLSLILAIFLLIGFKPYILVCFVVSLIFTGWYLLLKRRVLLSVFSMILLISLVALVFRGARETVVHYLTRKQFDFINVGKGGLHVQKDSTFYFFQPHQYSKLSINQTSAVLLEPTQALYYRVGSKESPRKVLLLPTGEKWPIVYFKSGCESYIEIKRIDESAFQLVKNIPEALLNSFLRPFPWDNGSNLKYFALIEVWLIVGVMLFAIVNRRKLNVRERTLVIGLIYFSLVLLILIGWTTPVIGAIARYRFPAQLAIIICCSILIDAKKWRKDTR